MPQQNGTQTTSMLGLSLRGNVQRMAQAGEEYERKKVASQSRAKLMPRKNDFAAVTLSQATVAELRLSQMSQQRSPASCLASYCAMGSAQTGTTFQLFERFEERGSGGAFIGTAYPAC